MPKKKFYVVRIGRVPGIYEDWESTRAQEWFNGGRDECPVTPPPPRRSSVQRPRVAPGSAPSAAIDVDNYEVFEDPPSSPDFEILTQPPDKPITPAKHRRVGSLRDEGYNDYSIRRRSKTSSSPEIVPILSPSRGLEGLTVEERVENEGDLIAEIAANGLAANQRANVNNDDEEDDEVDNFKLSPQQAETVLRVVNGESIFFTGSAGTGKSVLLRAIIRRFKARKHAHFCDVNREATGARMEALMEDGQVRAVCNGCRADKRGKVLAVTATTGMAALCVARLRVETDIRNIGGCTVHSWAGVGFGDEEVKALIGKVRNTPFARKRWEETDILIVDEISMLNAELLDKFNTIGKSIREDSRPFGGLQLVFCGDFFQLPPVSKGGSYGVGPKFAFDAECWEKAFPRSSIIHLKSVFRQTDDTFVKVLESMRRGSLTDEQDLLLRRLDRPLSMTDGISPVRLYSRRAQVEGENMTQLNKLSGPRKVYQAKDKGYFNVKGYPVSRDQATALLNKNGRWAEEVTLAVGAQVMLVTNWKDTGLVNGSTGRVMGFVNVAEATKMGAYVFSDARGVREGSGGCQPKPAADEYWPLVQFAEHRAHSNLPKLVMVPQMTLTVDNADGRLEASRTQVPLILAWAITIHKAQGLTLDKVCVDLVGTFDTGQAYVAISRARSLKGLELKGYNRGLVKTSQRVLEWAQEMEDDEAFDEAFDEALGEVWDDVMPSI